MIFKIKEVVMKKWMKPNLLKNLSSQLLTIGSVIMMVMAPVVDGFAAEKVMKDLNEARVKELLVQMGLTKSQTLGDFYKKNKSQMPKRLQNLIVEAVEKNKNIKMPRLEMTSSKTPDGKSVPVVRMVFGGELFNVEIHDNDKYFAKIGNTELTRIEVNNFTTLFEKLYHNDPRFRRLVDGNQPTGAKNAIFPLKATQVKNEFGYPDMTKEIWKSLTPEGRVQYILNMRNLWTASMSVLINKKDSSIRRQNSKKTSGIDLLEKIWKELNPDAEALDDAATKNARSKEKIERGAPAGTGKAVVNSSCLVAGYITEYRGKVCGLDAIKTRYKDNKTVIQAQSGCGANEIACNPLIYGFPGGAPTCVPISYSKDAPFQIATHFRGPCDSASPLSEEEVPLLKNDKLTGKDRYAESNYLDPQKVKEEIRTQQSKNGYEQTKEFLAGVIKSKNKELYDLFIKEPPEINDDILNIIKETKSEFNKQILEAREACTNSAKSGRSQESGFWGACDQMHRRELFVGDFLETQIKCIDGGKLNKETYKCSCPEAKFGREKIALPGQSCSGSGAGAGSGGANECRAGSTDPMCQGGGGAADTPEAKCQSVGMVLQPGKPSASSDEFSCSCGKLTASWTDISGNKFDPKKCQTSAGATPPPERGRPGTADRDDGSCTVSLQQICQDEKGTWVPIVSGEARACTCKPKADGEEKESWWSKHKNDVIKYSILGVALWALLKSAPRKPSLNPAGDNCANGVVACPTTCPKANQAAVNGVCQCRVPSPLEVLVDPVECTYATNTGSTSTLTCPNGTTQTANLTDCPKKACSDGSTVYDGQACPVETPTTKPTATGADVKK
jgi:hypothetical protein